MQRKSNPDELIRMLYDIADDVEAPANSRLSAIKEILDRTVGKGVMLGGEQTEVQPVEIVFRIVDDTTPPYPGGRRRSCSRPPPKPRPAARQAAHKPPASCSMLCGLRCAIRVRGSSCCDGPCRSWSARSYRRLCGCIRSALPNTR